MWHGGRSALDAVHSFINLFKKVMPWLWQAGKKKKLNLDLVSCEVIPTEILTSMLTRQMIWVGVVTKSV